MCDRLSTGVREQGVLGFTGVDLIADGVVVAVLGRYRCHQVPEQERDDHVDAAHEGRSQHFQDHLYMKKKKQKKKQGAWQHSRVKGGYYSHNKNYLPRLLHRMFLLPSHTMFCCRVHYYIVCRLNRNFSFWCGILLFLIELCSIQNILARPTALISHRLNYQCRQRAGVLTA